MNNFFDLRPKTRIEYFSTIEDFRCYQDMMGGEPDLDGWFLRSVEVDSSKRFIWGKAVFEKVTFVQDLQITA